MEYEYHEYCLMFPEADEETLTQMARDIQENGLNEPIVLYDNQILDGRNRYLACKLAGVEPSFKTYVGDDPFQFAVSKNLYRRHLTESQRALLAQKLYRKTNENGKILDIYGRKKALSLETVGAAFDLKPELVRQAIKVAEVGLDSMQDHISGGFLTVQRANGIINKAQKAAGLQSVYNLSSADLRKLKEAQKKIMMGEIPDYMKLSDLPSSESEEFNQSVLAGVYDAKRYRQDIKEIQEIVARMETLPTLFDDALTLVGTLEQERMLIAALDMLIFGTKKALKKLHTVSIAYDDVLSVVASLMDGRFKLPEIQQADEHFVIDELRNSYISDCEALLKEAADLKRKAKNSATRNQANQAEQRNSSNFNSVED